MELIPIETLIKEADDYDQVFLALLSDPDFKKMKNCIKIFAKPMRTGKDYSEVRFRIRYLLEKHPIRFHLATTPDNCIINDWENEMKNMCAKSGWRFETDPEAIIEALESNMKVVTYITNNKAYTAKSMFRLYDYLDKNKMFDVCSFNADEFHTWTLSCPENALAVKGWVGDKKDMKTVMYNLLMRIAAESPYTFGKTATANREVTGKVDTGGVLKYKLINPLVAGEQKQYAHRVGHLGNVLYYTCSSTLYENDMMTREEAFTYCLDTEILLSKEVNIKRAILIPCSDDRENRKHDDPTPEEFLEDYVKSNADLIGDGDVEIRFVMTCDESYSFDRNGNKIADKLNPKEVIRRINDIKDPAILLVVKNMAGRGVSLPTVKAIFFAKQIDRQGSDGIVTEMIEQIFGRAKNVFIGALQDKFWSEYGGDLNNVPLSPRSIKVLNQYNLYMPDTLTMKASVENHRKFDACTWDMIEGSMKEQADICPLCKRPFSKDEDDSGIDEHELCRQEELWPRALQEELGVLVIK